MARFDRLRHWLIWIGLVLLVVGAKLWLIDTAGSSLPEWDQVDGEGEVVLRPWLEGELRPYNFWHPHNEHRIVYTKLLAWGLVAADGQWDAYLEMFVNTFLHALLLPVLLLWLRPRMGRIGFTVLAVVGTTLWALPIDWENTLQGFQNQFYFIIWFAFLQCRWVLAEERFGWRWWGGNLCGLLGLFAMGSGLLSSIAVAAVVALDLVRRRGFTRWHTITLAVTVGWIALGWFTRNPVAGHDPLKATSFGQFLQKLWELGAWPFSSWLVPASIFALVVPAACVVFWRRGLAAGFDRTYVALAAWVALIMAATAYYRANGAVLSPRYFDQYYVGLLLQGAALALIPQLVWRRSLLALWTVALAFVLTKGTHHAYSGSIQRRAASFQKQETHIRDFLASNDPTVLTNAPLKELPYPSAAVLADRWSHASIQSVMPASVRKPVDIATVDPTATTDLPPAPYPVIAVSPRGAQTEPWIWRSERQPDSTLPVLRFRFSGELGDPRAALSMRIVSDAWAINVVPDGAAPHRWKTINVVRPPGEWWIELADRDSAANFALTAPVELGWLSWSTEKAIKYHRWWISAGLVLILGGVLALVPSRRLTPAA